uniref:Retrovirus-related Pol polyprotein from transposon TNT 1-94 n=1 Tax=Tanacetum cinerariifolium TaxID=118510 RepID=A0A6L2MFB2_TANCI|nr:retrovirus-related Pol polyprotein from transposon TNT 1-94 [Tanacetum cinerariifolium]
MIDLLVQKYEQFIISEDESIDSAFARFNTIITSLKALDEGYSSKNYVRKFLRALHPKWRVKVTKGRRTIRHGSKRLQEVLQEKRCDDPNHLIGECSKALKDKNQIAFVRGSWSDIGEEDDEKVNNKTCLVAQASSEICLGVELEPEEWIKDSGCSKHMEGNRNHFSTYKAYNGGNVIFGSNLRGNIFGKGQICDNKCRVTFSKHDSEIIKDGKVIGRASKELVRNLLKLKFDQHFYDACKIRKQAHASHKTKNIVSTTRCLELIHMDLFGPFAIRSYRGNRCTLDIVDDYSRKVKESLNVTFNETPPPSKTLPLVDDDLDEKEAIKVTEKKNIENDIVDETLEIDKIVNIKESRNHPLENVIGNLNQRTLRSQAQNQRLWYPKGTDIETVVYVNSDHARDFVARKSTSGICTFVGCCLTSWFSKKQTTLAISTIEAEYISSGKACQVCRIRHEEEIDVLEYQILTREIVPTLNPLEEIIQENVTRQKRLILPYGMLLTRLFKIIMNENHELYNESYVLYDRVMNPIFAQQERKPRKDRGTRRGHHFTSYSSAFDQPSSSYLNDDDDDVNSEGTLRASTLSPIRYVNSLTNEVPKVLQNPPNIDPHLEPFYTRQTEIINCKVQIRDEHRKGLRLIKKGFGNLWINIKKPLNSRSLQSHLSLDITLSLSPITLLDHIHDTPSPPSPPQPQPPIMGHPLYYKYHDYHGSNCICCFDNRTLFLTLRDEINIMFAYLEYLLIITITSHFPPPP